MVKVLFFILLSSFIFLGCAKSNLNIEEKEIFNIHKHDLKKIYREKDLKKSTLEYSIQNALLRQYEYRSLHLRNLAISPLSKKKTQEHIVTIWFSYPSLSFITYFNKLSFELEKVKIFTDIKIYDTTSNLEQAIGIKELDVGIYNLKNNRFTTITKTITDEYFNRIFYSPNESYIVTILGEPQYTRVKIFDRNSLKLLFKKDYFDKWFFPDVEISFSDNEELFSVSVGIINNEKASTFKTYSTKNFKEITVNRKEK